MSQPVLLYIGPGAGLEAIGALWALIATLGAAFGVILLAPIRALVRKLSGKRKKPEARGQGAEGGGEGAGDGVEPAREEPGKPGSQ